MTTSVINTHPLRVDNVGQRFGKKWVLRGCTFDLRPGVVTALIGPNGAGKSTLMSAAAGLHIPTQGTINVGGSSVTASPSHPDLGYLAQDKPLYRQYKVRDMIAIAAHLNARWDQAHAEELIAAAGLDDAQKVGTLSGGQRTRLALALVLARRPKVLLLDEPLADLDPLARLQVQQTLMAEVAQTGMTVLMSSHILGEVVDLCEDILIMGSGQITLSGPIDEILSGHRVLVGPRASSAELGFLPQGCIVEEQHAARQTILLVNHPVAPLPAGWAVSDPSLDDVVIAYLRSGSAATKPAVQGRRMDGGLLQPPPSEPAAHDRPDEEGTS